MTVDEALQQRAPQPELKPLGVTPTLREYIRDIWARREFAIAVPVGELRAKNMDTVLGNLWHLLNPILLVAVYYLIFGVVLEAVREGVDNFIAFLTIGIFLFHYTQKSVVAGSKSVVSNLGLIRSVQFPRALLPLSTTIGQTVGALPSFLLMFTVALLTGETPSLWWLLLPAIVLVQAVFNLGGSMITARLTDHYRDVQHVLPFVFRLLFYGSGVLYSVERFVPDPRQQLLFDFNPLYAFLTLARLAILDGTTSPRLWAIVMGWTVAVFVIGVLFFRAGEKQYGRG